MQIMEEVIQAGQNSAADATAVEGALRQVNAIQAPHMQFMESLRRTPAMHGLATAIPMALALWLGLLLWVLVR